MKEPVINITKDILRLVAAVDEFRGEWKALSNLAPDRLNALKKIATIESVGSSTRIEGVKLTDREVEQIFFGLDTMSFRSRDEEEVVGYAEVMNLVFESFQEILVTENHIKQLHHNLKAKELHPLLIIAVFVVHFLAIHPFQDGNGRLSRILTTLLLLQNGYSYVPYSSLESIIEQNKDNYYLALRKAQRTLDTDNSGLGNWLSFFLNCLRKQKDNLVQKIATEHKRIKLPALSNQILEIIKEHGQATISDVQAITDANRNTIKIRLRELVADNYLVKIGRGKSTRYTIGNRLFF
jgi:Fic family protein